MFLAEHEENPQEVKCFKLDSPNYIFKFLHLVLAWLM